jgi:hypothetical protein
VIGWPIGLALAHQGKSARSADARISAYERADAAINQLGPHLFPLIDKAERKVLGTRALPPSEHPAVERAGRYVLQGIIDVLGHTQLDEESTNNPLKRAIVEQVPDLAGEYEIIIDYKGARRPHRDDNPRGDWKLGQWQVQTYASLRSQPGAKEIASLRREMTDGTTDLVPAPGSADYYQINAWMPGHALTLTTDFRLRRAIRVVPVDAASMAEATGMIDGVARAIEDRVAEERGSLRIKQAWPADSDDEDTCVACDFRVSCERYNRNVGLSPPEGVRRVPRPRSQAPRPRSR